MHHQRRRDEQRHHLDHHHEIGHRALVAHVQRVGGGRRVHLHLDALDQHRVLQHHENHERAGHQRRRLDGRRHVLVHSRLGCRLLHQHNHVVAHRVHDHHHLHAHHIVPHLQVHDRNLPLGKCVLHAHGRRMHHIQRQWYHDEQQHHLDHLHQPGHQALVGHEQRVGGGRLVRLHPDALDQHQVLQHHEHHERAGHQRHRFLGRRNNLHHRLHCRHLHRHDHDVVHRVLDHHHLRGQPLLRCHRARCHRRRRPSLA
ncbi:hypothetical protein BU14_0052s0058 [Porphyra umbilicalis]|uniref:Uncharacterized protein n=1 Tax=Porphyra umbilicalis TaxID=2786 RepID=A0A1X6PIE1_PORUM|nr:hypothetical protein BU14_0052s0058 [Porphyra umbilicalis]|eukprot:OSX80443.1 hypothetical protein BU14_0052s0058 [Porphyra umbilicalis]